MSKQAKLPPSFPALVQAYFAEYLTQQRALSAQTIAAYRDGFVLFLGFAESRLGKSPDIADALALTFTAPVVRAAAVAAARNPGQTNARQGYVPYARQRR